MRCLWLGRIIPYPVISGDRLYTGRLVEALAAAGAQVRFLGFDGGELHPPCDNIEWVTVPGSPYGQIRGLFSLMPLVAARHRTTEFVNAVAAEISRPEGWDALIIDQYGMGWVLDLLSDSFKVKTKIIFVAHDHEESVTKSLWKNTSKAPHRKAFLFLNYLKTRAIERRIVAESDLVTTITEIDADLFEAQSGATKTLTLSPGYSGAAIPARLIDASIPRRIILFGGLQWSAKQENLRLFLDAADEILAANQIQIQIVGDVPESFGAEISARYKAVDVVGYVNDPLPYLSQARLGVIAEPIGGGFKMKMLDYIFNHVPILALKECVAGLPFPVSEFVFTEPNLPMLVDRLVVLIDNVAVLNDAQKNALEAAQKLFNWNERGLSFLARLEQNPSSVSNTLVE